MASIDGLASGLNTTDIIRQLMQLERQPQVKLQSQQKTVESAISALRGLNTRMLSVTSAADKLMQPNAWQPTASTSSDPTRVAVSSTSGAPQGSLTFSVERLATGTTTLTSGHVTDRALAGGVLAANSTISITKASDPTKPVTVSTGDGSLNAVVKAINAAGAGVTASVVQLVSGEHKLQLSSATTGANSAFKVETSAGSGVDPFAATLGAATTVQTGQDAWLKALGTDVYRSSNTVSDLLQGTTLTLAKAEPGVAVTVQVKSDAATATAQVQSLVDALNSARGEVARLTAFDLETKRKGALYGDSTTRGLRERIATAVSGGIGTSAQAAGISIARDGTITFDKAAFEKAYAADPAKVESLLGSNGLAGRVHAMADAVSRSAADSDGPGVIANAIASRERQARSLRTDITNWDNRLELRERTLQRQFAALETAMGRAKSQSSWLAGQIAGLPSGGGR